MKNVCLSLADIAGTGYIQAVCRASADLGLGEFEELLAAGFEKVEFFPPAFEEKIHDLLEKCGSQVSQGLASSSSGAATSAFAAAFHREHAPLSGLGPFRLGEDGILSLIGKSEHYQTSLGHNFPGFKLLINAQRIGILNATHNNTRGHLTRLLEKELVRIANGIAPGDEEALERVLSSKEPHVLNRVINLETGSLACEAAIKMMLARFYKLQPTLPSPVYEGKTPVFLVMQDFKGGREANYHGTCITAQTMRGMWQEFASGMEEKGLLKTVAVKINDLDDFKKAVQEFDSGNYKIAGFIHELVLMNYGAIALTEEYVTVTDKICHEHDIPVFVDEIQSCMWSDKLLMFKEYASTPDFVSIGKGFPAGCYPASKMLTTSAMDNLNLFGALVTNGQEELASLANLITIRFAEENKNHIAAISAQWQQGLAEIAKKHADKIVKTEGRGLLTSFVFSDTDKAVRFGKALGERYRIDAGVQTYKADCPPAVLNKLPLISSEKVISFVLDAMDELLKEA